MRKPNSEIYKYVLNEHDLQAKRTLFIDDKKKILTLRFIRFTSMEFTGRQRRRGGLIQKTYYRNPLWKLKTPTIPSNLRPKKYYIKKKIVNFSVLPILFNRRRSKTHYRRFKKKTSTCRSFCYAYQIGTDTILIEPMTENQAIVLECLFTDKYFPFSQTYL
jgi:hypothetical protein